MFGFSFTVLIFLASAKWAQKKARPFLWKLESLGKYELAT